MLTGPADGEMVGRSHRHWRPAYSVGGPFSSRQPSFSGVTLSEEKGLVALVEPGLTAERDSCILTKGLSGGKSSSLDWSMGCDRPIDSRSQEAEPKLGSSHPLQENPNSCLGHRARICKDGSGRGGRG